MSDPACVYLVLIQFVTMRRKRFLEMNRSVDPSQSTSNMNRVLKRKKLDLFSSPLTFPSVPASGYHAVRKQTVNTAPRRQIICIFLAGDEKEIYRK